MKRLDQLMRLDGSRALVTGASGHVARAVAEALAELGCGLVLTDRDDSVQQVASELAAVWHVDVRPLVADLADSAAVGALAKDALAGRERLDVLVHCGAMVSAEQREGWTCGFEDQGLEPWRRALAVNLTAPFLLTQALAPALRQARGRVIAIGSIYGMLGPDLGLYDGTAMGNSAAYAASKGGLLQLTRWLATVMAPDVRVNTITLGGIERQQPQSFQDRYVARTPLRRMGTEEDIKGAVAFLATGASAYVTGQNVAVDGGFSAW